MEFQTALQSLEGLPVWVVVRLCTNEHQVVEFYNNLDSQLELSLKVIDDIWVRHRKSTNTTSGSIIRFRFMGNRDGL
jgi:hypothetical protein